jgi:hypothetical protein
MLSTYSTCLRWVQYYLLASVVLAVGCNQEPPRAPVLGEAYVGPANLKLRNDLPLQSKTVATAAHGDRVEIVQRRRRFLKVRTASGAEGWTEDRQLLASADMAALRDLSQQAKAMLAQGQATTFGDLNVHTQPARTSPSFIQLKEGDKVDVLFHRALPRNASPSRQPLLPPAPKKAKVARKPKEKDKEKIPPPPPPKPPAPPADWLELSRTDLDEEPADDSKDDRGAPPVALDDWSLIRTASGASGWVLTRRLVMAIPDEVAQYAEGRRIVSYFSLGDTDFKGEKKHNWLWTTIGPGNPAWDFDSFRVFVWSQRRHHYETAYIERNLKGYAPVLMGPVEYRGQPYPGFSVCMEKKDGQRYRRAYAFIGQTVRLGNEKPCDAPPEIAMRAPTAAPLPGARSAAPEPPAESWGARLKRRWRSLTGGK